MLLQGTFAKFIATSLREMERKLKLSRTSLRTYRNRSESSGLSMIDLLKLNNAKCRQLC